MKKVFALLTVFLFCAFSLHLSAEDLLGALTEKAENSCLTFRYEYETSGRVKVEGRGDARVQGSAFVLNVNGVKVISDGTTKWTIDAKEKEVVIEKLNANDNFITPTLFFSSVKNKFDKSAYYKDRVKGIEVDCIELKPKFKSDIVCIKLYFYKSVLKYSKVVVRNATETFFDIMDIKEVRKGDIKSFTFNSSVLDPSWIVTDLR